MESGGYPRGGAGGGAYAKKTVPVTPGMSYAYVVGMGDFGADKDTHWINASTVMARGGNSSNSPEGALGGAASGSVGDVKYSGGDGGDCDLSEYTSGGGGGGAGSAGNGSNGELGTGGMGQYEYGGDGGSGAYLSQGEPGNPFGGGAAGSLTENDVSGADGLIRLTYDVVPINDCSFHTSSRGMFCGAFRKMG